MNERVIQYLRGTGWEADDRKGLGCHWGNLVAFAVNSHSFFQKNQEKLFSEIL